MPIIQLEDNKAAAQMSNREYLLLLSKLALSYVKGCQVTDGETDMMGGVVY